jgi:hypothetical protein
VTTIVRLVAERFLQGGVKGGKAHVLKTARLFETQRPGEYSLRRRVVDQAERVLLKHLTQDIALEWPVSSAQDSRLGMA